MEASSIFLLAIVVILGIGVISANTGKNKKK